MTANELGKRHHETHPLQHLTAEELDAIRTVISALISGGLLRLGIHETLGGLLELITYEEADRTFRDDIARLSESSDHRP